MTDAKAVKGKIMTVAEAIATIKNGSHVYSGSGCGEPQRLIHTLTNKHGLNVMTTGAGRLIENEKHQKLRRKSRQR